MTTETAPQGPGPNTGRADAAGALRAQMPEAVQEVVAYKGETTVLVDPGRIVDACRFLCEKPDLGFIMLIDLCATHWVDREYSYEVAYLLHSFLRGERIRLKVRLTEKGHVDTVTSIFPGADWLEREAYDLVGVVFDGHPDPRRILMPDDYDEFPLRKDFPVKGY